MNKILKKRYDSERRYSRIIEEILVKEGMKAERARETAFHLGEILPDFEAMVDKIKDGSLGYNDILEIVVHVPYHIEGLVKRWNE